MSLFVYNIKLFCPNNASIVFLFCLLDLLLLLVPLLLLNDESLDAASENVPTVVLSSLLPVYIICEYFTTESYRNAIMRTEDPKTNDVSSRMCVIQKFPIVGGRNIVNIVWMVIKSKDKINNNVIIPDYIKVRSRQLM